MSAVLETENSNKSVSTEIQDDVDPPSTINEHPPDGSDNHDDTHPTKKKKTRRGKPKRGPYVKLSWQQRQNSRVSKKKRTKIVKPGQALAPYNSNQFLIEDHDHGYLKEIEERLKTKIQRMKTVKTPRTRDSSFSVDSDMDYYSSPEDEEEFLTREFSNTYQDIRSERLTTMTREELMQECIQMENRLEVLTKCITPNEDATDGGSDFQKQLMKLMNENDLLRRENERLRKTTRRRKRRGSVSSSSSSVTSSMDSESDSSSGNSSSDSDSRLPKVDYSKTNGQESSSPRQPDEEN